jgi:hypothetical protein
MSAPEQTGSTPEGIKAETAGEPTSPMEVGQAVAQLRALLCGLGLAVLLLSLVFDAFVFKQNRNLQGEASNRKRQASQMAGTLERWMPALNELARYSAGNSESMAIFKRHGIEINAPPAGGTPTQPVQP